MADFPPPLLQTETPSNQNKFPFPSPSLPPNYVTLQQLQERRVKQQQEREAKEKEEEERQRQREEAEEERKRQREAKEEEEEERKKQLDLEKSLKTLETKPSDRSSRCNWGNRLKIAADKRGEIPTVERGIDGHGKSIERSNKKKIRKWREKTSPGERKTLTDGDPEHSLPENGKSAVDRKIGRGFLAVKMNRTAKIAREMEDLETEGRKEEERSTAVEKKGRAQSTPVESLPEKIGSNVVDDRMVKIDRQKISKNEIEGSTGGGKEADGTANKKLYSTPKREKYVKKKIGNVGVNCDQTVEGEKEVSERSNECGLGRRGEKMPATREENVEKEDKAVESAHKIEKLEIIDCDKADGENVGSFGQRSRRSFGYRKKKGGNVEAYQTVEGGIEVEEGLNEHGLGRPGEKMPATREENVKKEDKVVEIAHKIEELEIVDCDEVDGENAGERSRKEKKLGDWRQRERRNFGQRRGFGCGRGFGYGRSFGYQERRQPRHLTWVRKEENSNGSMRPV